MTVRAGAIIRQARRRARLSQPDLARRSGVAQSVISAYESDHREPGLHTLVKLVEATGHDLVISLVPVRGHPSGLPDTPLGRKLRRHRRTIVERAARSGAHNVRVFGSAARGDNTDASDVDLLVDLDDGVGLFALNRLRRELSDLLNVDVDLVPADSVKSAIADEVVDQAVAL